MFRRALSLLLLGLAVNASWAQSVAAPDQPAATPDQAGTPPQEQKRIYRVNNLFSGDLPQLDLPGTYKLILRPHFGDLIRRDYMRVDAGLRWSMDDDFEVSAEGSVYFTHGLGGQTNDGSGVGQVRLGGSYIFEHWPRSDYETSLGLNVALPTGHPPVDMTDGHYHVAPTLIVQHNWTSVRHLTTFGGVGVDILGQSNVAGTFATNEPHDDAMSVTTGAVYDVGQLKWTLTGTYATTALIGNETANFFYLQPGVLWYVPSRFTFHSKTQWIFGLNAGASWGPDHFHVSLGSRLRAEITFRQVMNTLHLSGKHTP